MKTLALVVAHFMVLSAGLVEAAPVSGEAVEYTSANGVAEQCIRITPIPGAAYRNHDDNHEKSYCEIDFAKVALCPKLWSTSPGTVVFEIDAAAYGGDYSAFEKQHCADGHHAKDAALSKLASFKISVNAQDTSGTYAPSSWVYYHLSRYFDTNVHVPVAVYRSMDAQLHHERVVKPALSLVANRRHVKMLAAGWSYLDTVESGSEGSSNHAVLTDEGRQVFGVLLDNKGDRYGPEFNGTRESGWGNGQNYDFQQTAPFLALRNESPVAEAAEAAVREARKNPRMAKALAADTSREQVILWMQDVIEITLLDYMLGQQDRIGNIDYNWRWYWVEEGKLKSDAAHGHEPPEEIAGFKPLRLRQSAINDNDAGVRRGYANFTQRTHMLENLNHYDPALYQRLGRLAADFGSKGEIYQWMRGAAGLSEREADAIAERTLEAFSMIQGQCRAGTMKLDLVLPALLAGLEPQLANASCDVDTQ